MVSKLEKGFRTKWVRNTKLNVPISKFHCFLDKILRTSGTELLRQMKMDTLWKVQQKLSVIRLFHPFKSDTWSIAEKRPGWISMTILSHMFQTLIGIKLECSNDSDIFFGHDTFRFWLVPKFRQFSSWTIMENNSKTKINML